MLTAEKGGYMKLHGQHAEALLFQKINGLFEDNCGLKCIHVKLSQQFGNYHPTLCNHFLAREIEGLLTEEDGNIYLCRDLDLFILFTGRVRPLLVKLVRYFMAIEFGYGAAQYKDLFAIYDLSHDWRQFCSLCYHKLLGHRTDRHDALIALGASRVAMLIGANNEAGLLN